MGWGASTSTMGEQSRTEPEDVAAVSNTLATDRNWAVFFVAWPPRRSPWTGQRTGLLKFFFGPPPPFSLWGGGGRGGGGDVEGSLVEGGKETRRGHGLRKGNNEWNLNGMMSFGVGMDGEVA